MPVVHIMLISFNLVLKLVQSNLLSTIIHFYVSNELQGVPLSVPILIDLVNNINDKCLYAEKRVNVTVKISVAVY